MCGSHLSGVTKLRRSMSTDLLERIEKEVMPTIEEFSLTVAGEPFLTPKLPQFVAVAERSGAELSINTNATLIKDTNLLRRTMTNARVIRFSVDGASKETYESIRVQSDFDLVMANIELVVQVRNALPREQRPRLVMCMVLMQRNMHELVAMVELAHRLGMDRLDVAHLTVLVPEMDEESLRHEPAKADAALRMAQERANALGFRVNLPPMMSGVRLRPTWAAATRNESSFEAIWNGSILTAMRRGFIQGDPFDCCAHCSQNPEGYQPGDPNTVAPKAYDLPGLSDRKVANAK
jgi:molybdenum cofactor biosynthesis enzyme MoaA